MSDGESSVLPPVSVLIPTYMREEILCDTVEAVLELDYPCFEVVLVDQTPQHDAAVESRLREWEAQGRITRVRESVANLPRARNVGVFLASGEVVLFLDDDVTPVPELIREHVKHYADPTVWGVGGRTVLSEDEYGRDYPLPVPPEEAGDQWPLLLSRYTTPLPDALRVGGGNLSVRRNKFIEIGGFNENYPGNALGEDLEFVSRIRRAGGRTVYDPAAAAVHHMAGGGCRAEQDSGFEYSSLRARNSYYTLMRAKGYGGLIRESLRIWGQRVTGLAITFAGRPSPVAGPPLLPAPGPVAEVMSSDAGLPRKLQRVAALKTPQALASLVGLRRALRDYARDREVTGHYSRTATELQGRYGQRAPSAIGASSRREVIPPKSCQKVRVLHILGALTGGGIQSLALEILRHLDQSRFGMDVCTMSEDPGPLAAEARAAGARVYACSLRRNPFTYAERLARILHKGGYHVVHASSSSSTLGAPIWVAARAGVPVCVAHYQSVKSNRITLRNTVTSLLQRVVQKDAACIMGCSRSVLRSHFGPRWESDPRMHVVYNGIDAARYGDLSQRPAVRAEFGLQEDDLVVGNVGRFVMAKNHPLFVEIAAKVVEQVPQARFLLVGDGPLRPEIEARVERAGLESKFVFAGWRQDVPRVLTAMDVFLFPSLWEGLAIALIEAQASGLACVGSDLACFREVLPAEQQDYVFPLDQPERGAELVVSLLRDPDRRLELGAAAQAGSRRFDIKRTVRQIEELYLDSLGIE